MRLRSLFEHDFDPRRLRSFREQTLYRLLLRARRAENDAMVARISARGYPDLQPSYPALLANLDTEGTTATGLAAKTGVTRQAASQQLVEIEARGYIRREPHPTDGRTIIVRRTRRGEDLLRDALEVVSDLETEYGVVVGERRFAALKRTLTDLLVHIDPSGRLDS